MRLGVLTGDERLARKISLVLRTRAECEMITDAARAGEFDLVLADGRGGAEWALPEGVTALRIADREVAVAGELPYPFSFEELEALTVKRDSEGISRLVLEPDRQHARLDGERIRLTEVEARLLLAIMSGGGEYVSRERLIAEVWQGGVAEGALNVYIHYLREKLEGGGEKIILSSRKCGYKIDPRYTGGERSC